VSLLSLKAVISCPSTIIEPLLTKSIPPVTFSNVDFPEPDGPKIAPISPFSRDILTLFKALNLTSPVW